MWRGDSCPESGLKCSQFESAGVEFIRSHCVCLMGRGAALHQVWRRGRKSRTQLGDWLAGRFSRLPCPDARLLTGRFKGAR